MKKIISLIVIAALFLTGCSKNEKGIRGFTVATEPLYTTANNFSEGFALVSKPNEEGKTKYFFINTQGEVISKEYDKASDFSDGMAMVATKEVKNGLSVYTYGYINTKGEEVIPLQFTSDAVWAKAYSFYNGYALLEKFPIPGGDKNQTCSFMIDKEGNIAGDFVEYGGSYGEDTPADEVPSFDMRVLTLTEKPDTNPRSDYYGSSKLRYACYSGDFPVNIYDPVKKQTLTIDKNFKIIDSFDGFVRQEFENGYKYIDYDYGNLYSYNRALIDNKGNTVIDYIYYLEDCSDDILIISDGTYYRLYTTDGRQISEKYHGISRWEKGFIFETGRPDSIIVDRDLKELCRIDDIVTSQTDYKFNRDKTETYKYYLPLLVKKHDFTDGKYHSYFYSYYNPYTGKEVIPCVKDVEWQPLTEDFYFASTIEKHITVNPKPLEIYNVEKDMYFPLEGIDYIYEARLSYGDNAVVYQKTGSDEWYTAFVTAAENGAPIFNDERLQNPYKNGDIEYGAKVLAEEEESCIYLEDYVYGKLNPVKLKYKGDVLGEYYAASFVHRNIYMVSENVVDGTYFPKTKTIMSVSGEKLCETYDEMGILSENFIKYKKDGKWGYLKAE